MQNALQNSRDLANEFNRYRQLLYSCGYALSYSLFHLTHDTKQNRDCYMYCDNSESRVKIQTGINWVVFAFFSEKQNLVYIVEKKIATPCQSKPLKIQPDSHSPGGEPLVFETFNFTFANLKF